MKNRPDGARVYLGDNRRAVAVATRAIAAALDNDIAMKLPMAEQCPPQRHVDGHEAAAGQLSLVDLCCVLHDDGAHLTVDHPAELPAIEERCKPESIFTVGRQSPIRKIPDSPQRFPDKRGESS